MVRIKFAVVAFAVALMFVLGSVRQAEAASHGPLGLGIVLGDPTALTAKYDMDSRTAFDFGLAFDFSRWNLIYGDWHYKFPGALKGSNGFMNQVTPYVGVGGLLVFSNQDTVETRKQRYFNSTTDSRVALGVRVPLGLEWKTPDVPLGVFVEIVPGITIIPQTTSFTNAGIGIRYFF